MPPLPQGDYKIWAVPLGRVGCLCTGWAAAALPGLPGQCWAQHHPAALAAFCNRLLVWKCIAEKQTCTFKAKPNMSISWFLGSSPELVPTNKLLAVPLSSALPAPTCTGSAGARDMPLVFGVLENVLPKLGHHRSHQGWFLTLLTACCVGSILCYSWCHQQTSNPNNWCGLKPCS